MRNGGAWSWAASYIGYNSSELRNLAYHGLAALVVLWSARILVAGSYYSVWDLLWYNRPLPGVLPIILFLVSMPLATGSLTRFFLLPLSIGALILGDNVKLLSIPAAMAMPAGMAILQSSRGKLPYALALGIGIDLLLRVATRGLDPLEYTIGRVLLAGTLIVLFYASGVEVRVPSLQLASVISALELGLAYPSALLHYTGHEVYGLPMYASVGFMILVSVLVGTILARLHRDICILVIMVFAGMILDGLLGIGLIALSIAGLGALLSYERYGSRVKAFIGGLWFVIISFLGIAVYVYPYVGLSPFADRMELVMLIAMIGVALSSWPSEEEYNELSREDIVVDASMITPIIIGGLSLVLAVVLQSAPIGVESAGHVVMDVYTLNLHQGYDWSGRLNGREATMFIVEAARNGGIVCLQEVDAGRLTSMYIDMPLALYSRGVNVAYQPAIEDTYGVAVAGPKSLEKVGGVLLPSTGEQRAAVKANASGVIAVSAHLGLDPGERAIQAQALVDYSLKYPEALLLCGDFNEPRGAALDYISKYYTIAWPPKATCCLGTEENTTIDYIAVREGKAVVEEVSVLLAPSDHLAVYAKVRILEAGEGG